jgi:predicted CoA-binding protein
MSKKTLVMGASTNPTRYANMATHKLLEHQHEVELLGKKKGEVAGHPIHHSPEELGKEFHTVTMYLGESNQKEYYDYMLNLAPKRVIFNPGAENEELSKILSANEIEVVEACTLVLLATGQF